ncbi:MAG: hypothetical protein BMS9Abin13_281 [Patescibacteria group bacterium]|nr:MAG: hypothetical protein BMS9Abin13_281 [Patescibacteria group bacterium]
MSNLLPQYKKGKVRKEYYIRLGIVFSLLLSASILISMVLLVPSYILSSVKYNITYGQLEDEKARMAATPAGENPEEIIANVNSKLAGLKGEKLSPVVSYDLFGVIIGHKPPNLKINAFFYSDDRSRTTISISGVSENRESLLLFMQALEREPLFFSVDLPISYFVKGKDIGFSVKIIVSENNDEDDEEQ